MTHWTRSGIFLSAIVVAVVSAACAPQTARPCRDDDQCEADERCSVPGDGEVGACVAHAAGSDGGALRDDDGGTSPGSDDGGAPLGNDDGGTSPGSDDGGAPLGNDDGGASPGDNDGGVPHDGGDTPTGPVAAVQVSVGGGFMCARTDEGTVFCWGFDNDTGQLGRGTALDFNRFHDPAPVPLLSDVEDLAAGEDHACVIGRWNDNPRGVYCWGSGERALGTDDPPAARPFRVPLPEDVHAAAEQVTAGAGSACVRTSSNRVMCWGHLGSSAVLPTWQDALDGAPRLFHDELVICGDVPGVGLTCIGQGSGLTELGCSGSGTWTCPALDGAARFSYFPEVACAIVDGTLSCVGDNSWGQILPGVYSDDEPLTLVSLGASVEDVQVGIDNVCALLESGALRCWGRNPFGSTGQPDGEGSDDCGSGQRCHGALDVPGIGETAAFDTFDGTRCSVSTTGHVWCWGQFGAGGPSGTGTQSPARWVLPR